MNLENADRLIKMRRTNPNDEINFIYDSHLLNEQAKINLKEFCVLYQITPIDVSTNITPLLQSELETELLEFYKSEILSQYGNLGMASDILRWLILGLSLDLGCYTDFDVAVNTSNLPDRIQADAPLLFNIGSIIKNFPKFHHTNIEYNTDIILVSDSEDARQQIVIFQRVLLQSLKHEFLHEKSMFPIFDFLKPHFLMLKPEQAKKYFMELTENNRSFVLGLQGSLSKIDKFLLRIKSHFPTIYTDSSRALLQEPKERLRDTLTATRKQARHELLLNYVATVSGPDVLDKWFLYLPPSKDFVSLKPGDESSQESENELPLNFEVYSLYYAKLGNAFVSFNGAPLYSLPDAVEVKRLENAIVGDCGDLSWLEAGQNAQEKREKIVAETWQLTPALRMPYRFFAKKKVPNLQRIALSLYSLTLEAMNKDLKALDEFNHLLLSIPPTQRLRAIKEINPTKVPAYEGIQFESLLHLIAFIGAANLMSNVLNALPENERYLALKEPDANELKNTVIHTAIKSPACSSEMLDTMFFLISEEACLDIVEMLEQKYCSILVIDRILSRVSAELCQQIVTTKSAYQIKICQNIGMDLLFRILTIEQAIFCLETAHGTLGQAIVCRVNNHLETYKLVHALKDEPILPIMLLQKQYESEGKQYSLMYYLIREYSADELIEIFKLLPENKRVLLAQESPRILNWDEMDSSAGEKFNEKYREELLAQLESEGLIHSSPSMRF